MQTLRFGQAVALTLITALAVSCSATKEYSSKLFAPRTAPEKETAASNLKFLDLDESQTDPGNWVSTDFIMGRDSSQSTWALDNFIKTFPASSGVPAKPDSVSTKKEKEIKTALAEAGTRPASGEPVAKTPGDGTVRAKKSREE